MRTVIRAKLTITRGSIDPREKAEVLTEKSLGFEIPDQGEFGFDGPTNEKLLRQNLHYLLEAIRETVDELTVEEVLP